MVQKDQVDAGWADLFSAFIGAAITVFVAFLGWLTMVSRMQQRLEDHIKADDARFEAMDERLKREHAENRETLHRIDDKLDRLIERTPKRGA